MSLHNSSQISDFSSSQDVVCLVLVHASRLLNFVIVCNLLDICIRTFKSIDVRLNLNLSLINIVTIILTQKSLLTRKCLRLAS